MAKKSSSVTRTVKQTGKQRLKTEGGQNRIQKNMKTKAARLEVDVKRQLKIQKALYQIADAASAVKDMQSFYKKLHRIVGKFMYAENFFIALLEEQSDLVTWVYYVDTVDVEPPTPIQRKDHQGATGWVIRHGKTVADVDGSWAATIARGEARELASDSNGIAVPLKVKNETIGVVLVQSYIKGIGYQLEDVKILEFVAQHFATALTRARALEAEHQRTEELAILNSVGEAMSQTLDVKTVTRIVGNKVRDIFHSTGVSIMLLNAQTSMIHILYEYDSGEGGYIDYIEPFPLGTGLTSKVIQSRQPLLLSTAQEQLANGAYSPPELGTGAISESMMMVPILVSDKVLGVVSVNKYEQHAFDENSLHLLQTLSSNMGVAIENARLFEAEQQRVAELQIINSIQQGLAAELDFQAIVDLVGDKLREVFSTPNFGIDWYDEKNNLLHPLYAYEHGKRLDIPPQTAKPGGIFETIRKTRQPLLLNSAEDYARREIWNALPGTDQSKSLLALPIISNDRMLGVVSIKNYDRENAFGESEIRLLTTIAASLGNALENARLFDEVQKKNIEITEALEQQTATSDILRVIASSPTGIQPVLDVIAQNAAQLSASDDALIDLEDQGSLRVASHFGNIPMFPVGEGIPLNRESVAGRAIIDGRTIETIHKPVGAESEYPEGISGQTNTAIG